MKSRRINYFKYFSLFFAIAVLVFIAGCIGTPPAVPIINSFSANPSTITEGESSTLSWEVTGAATVSIDQGIGNVALSGTRDIYPSETTTYTLTAGSVTATTTITVNPAVPPVLLINYPMDPEQTTGDKLSRGFYIKQFPGTSLSQVDLWIGANTAGDYTFELTVREGVYDGPIIEKSQANISLTGNTDNKQLTTFNFSSKPVQMNSIVTFTISKISGPGTCYYCTHGEYGGIPEEDILVIQTSGTTPPLDSHRRYGIAIRVYGHE